MKTSEEVLKKAKIVPFLQLAIKSKGGGPKGTGPHKVKLISDRFVKGTDYKTGKERYEVQYLVEEDGQKKKYNVPLKNENGEIHYLIQRLGPIKEGTEIVLEYIRKEGSVRGFIDVQPAGEEEVSDEDIPVIDEEKNYEEEPTTPSESEFTPDIPVEGAE